jgi:putative GTP pyrophosphokinase
MVEDFRFSADEQKLIADIVAHYRQTELSVAARVARNLLGLFSDDERLARLIHSMKARPKDPARLEDKLSRKLQKCKRDGQRFEVTPDNLFDKINDLAGVRLLHLHTSQFKGINDALLELLANEGYRVREGPIARAWDDEYREHFRKLGIETKPAERMYTSVHYVVETSARVMQTAEIQVRTLAEELWGEVDHSFNYPHEYPDVACVEQIKVLARVTMGATRLVDSIFMSRVEAERRAKENEAREAPPVPKV